MAKHLEIAAVLAATPLRCSLCAQVKQADCSCCKRPICTGHNPGYTLWRIITFAVCPDCAKKRISQQIFRFLRNS